MNERDALRYAGRRAALLAAIRAGDARTAARAGARLRLQGATLAPAEFMRARDARRTLGRALIGARAQRSTPKPLIRLESISAPRPSRRKYAYAAVGLAILALILFLMNDGLTPGGTPAGAPPLAAPDQVRAQLLTVSRGRTIVPPGEIVVVQESPSPTPTPTEEPTASPTPQVATSSAATGTGTRTGSPAPIGSGGNGGSGDGSGSGNGSGSGSGTSTPRPTPTPPVPPPGFTRLNVIVLDATNGRPLPDVCVVLGTADCGPGQPHTGANGRWSADVAASSSATFWDMAFIKAGYVTQVRRLTLPGGRSVTFQILLRRVR